MLVYTPFHPLKWSDGVVAVILVLMIRGSYVLSQLMTAVIGWALVLHPVLAPGSVLSSGPRTRF